MYRRILVATDGSPRSLKAVAAAVELAKLSGARLFSVYVVEEGIPTVFDGDRMLDSTLFARPWRDAVRAAAARALDAAAAAADRAGVAHESVRTRARTPWRAILRAAQAHRCDLIVMASRGPRGLGMLASHTMRTIAHARVPVLVCREARGGR